MSERLDFVPIEEGATFKAVNVKTRNPSTVGYYLLCTNALPNVCGRVWFDGKKFVLTSRHYHYSSLLANGKELFWLELETELVTAETDQCWNCQKDLGYKLKGCCSGLDCGCMGLPTDPPFCSEQCGEEYRNKLKGGVEV